MMRMFSCTRSTFTAVLAVWMIGTTLTARAEDKASSSAPAATSGGGFATTGNDPFAMGEMVAFAGVSPGVFNGVYGAMIIPPIHVGLDYAFHQYLTAGGVFGFSRYDYYKESLTYLTFEARGTFHPTFWLQRVKVPIDPYGIATIGYTIGSYSGTSGVDFNYLVIGPGVGIRYWFNPHWSGQAEAGLGYGLGLGSIAIAYKF